MPIGCIVCCPASNYAMVKVIKSFMTFTSSVKEQSLMKYINAADALPAELVEEIMKYVDGGMIYVPSSKEKQPWGKASGSRQFYEERNCEIRELFGKGASISKLACDFGLSYETLRKIVKK